MIQLCTSSVYSGPDTIHPHNSRLMQHLPTNSIKLRAWICSKRLLIYSATFDSNVVVEILTTCKCRGPALVIVELGLWN